jgi:hypothetical protein
MEILWPALGIAAIVVFVFYILAEYWRRVLRQQSWIIRRLADRVQNLEDMVDPELRRRLGEAAPVPLEQVFTLSVRWSERFWRDTLHTSDEARQFIRDHGSLLGSVKLERWRSHTVATVTEILPERKTAGWQTRTLDLYPDARRGGEALTLWELALSPTGLSAERPPSLELVLRANALELQGHLGALAESATGNGHAAVPPRDPMVFFRLPLDPEQLAEFRSHDPLVAANAAGPDNGGGQSAASDIGPGGNSWQAFYSNHNEALGIEWQLRLRDLGKKAEWERWRILESGAIPVAGD